MWIEEEPSTWAELIHGFLMRHWWVMPLLQVSVCLALAATGEWVLAACFAMVFVCFSR